tara:strand:- start:4366 stop:4827 length:462 start_codon:yes stop_codon:yes gene_type:complete
MKIRDITEVKNQQLNELAPIGAAAIWVLRWVGMKAAWPLFKWALKKMFKLGIIGFGTYTVADWTWDKIEEMLGAEAVQLLQEHGIELALAAAFVISAIVVKRWIEKKGDELLANKKNVAEQYTQKDGDYAKGNAPMPKKKKRGPHPLGGKLVG